MQKPFSLSAIPVSIALVVAGISTATTFDFSLIASIAQFAGIALVVTLLGSGLVFLQMRLVHLSCERLALIGAIACVCMAMAVYVEWHAYVIAYQESRFTYFETAYSRQAPIWKWVDENVPADGTVAYANTFFIYPYYGFGLTRRLEYAPIRRGLHDFSRFPRMGDRLPGDLIVRRMTEVMNENADRDTWIENLRAMKAGYLVAMKADPDNRDLSADTPELRFARDEPGRFIPVEETEGGVVFRIEWK
jgi:hypothetical protein